MKKILKALLVLIGMIAMLFVVAVIVNLSVFDEELLPEVQAIKDIEAKPYGTENAYPALLAMSYYPNLSYQAATAKIRNRLNKNISDDGQDFLNTKDIESLKNQKIRRTQLTEYSKCTTRKDLNCIQDSIMLLKNQTITDQYTLTLLERYEQLIKYHHFSENTQLDLTESLPSYGSILNIQRVFLLRQWLENNQNLVPLIIKDLIFWRMVLKDNNLLITKMIAIAAIHNDIQTLAYVIQFGELKSNQLHDIQNQIEQLTQKERDMLRTIQFEMKYAMSTFYTIANETDAFIDQLFSQPFYQPQATINQYYLANIGSATQLNKLDSPAFYQAYQVDKWPYKPQFKSHISLYNPSGKLLVKYSTGAYQNYIARVHDLNAMLALLNLRIDLVLNNDQNITAVINNSIHKNPYTEKPFDYGAEAQTIGFECLDKTSVCEIAL